MKVREFHSGLYNFEFFMGKEGVDAEFYQLHSKQDITREDAS
jgi:hypothetical protein